MSFRLLLPGIALVLAACSGGPEGTRTAPPSPFDGSWMDRVVEQPLLFSNLVDGTSRDGWIAFHGNDYDRAVASFAGQGADARVARTRALLEQSHFYGDLARISGTAWQRLYQTWDRRATLPEGSALPCLAGLAALDAGEVGQARAWFEAAAAASDPQVAAAADQLAKRSALEPFEGEALPPLLERVNLHLQARSSGDVSAVRAVASQPLVKEDNRDPETGRVVVRHFYDPLVMRTLAMAYQKRAAQVAERDPAVERLAHLPQGASPLAALLFGSVVDQEQLRVEVERVSGGSSGTLGTLGAGAPLLRELELESSPPGGADDAEWARRQVRAFDARLDAWVTEEHTAASDDGRALLDDLGLAALFRSRVLLALARQAVLQERPRQALAFAQLALDLEAPREITPVNHPALLAVMVEAQLFTGHTREALDALQVLVQEEQAVEGLDELVGDLAILQGLDRLGDSKEH